MGEFSEPGCRHGWRQANVPRQAMPATVPECARAWVRWCPGRQCPRPCQSVHVPGCGGAQADYAHELCPYSDVSLSARTRRDLWANVLRWGWAGLWLLGAGGLV